MKKYKNKLIIFFLLIVPIGIFILSHRANAQSDEKSDPVIFTPQITIPGSDFQKKIDYEIKDSTTTIGDYIKSIYNYFLAIVGLLAVIVLMASGIIWMTAAGNTERISQAKGWMTGSLTGLVLMLFSYVLLKTINPNLVNFKTTPIQSLEKLEKGCCKLTNYKDTSGMFTGSSNTSITITIEALSCYLAAVELNEPGVKRLEELTKEEKENIQKYLTQTGKFLPNYVSSKFTQCIQTGACLTFYEDLMFNNGKYIGTCIPTTRDNCEESVIKIFKPNLNCKQPDSVYREILEKEKPQIINIAGELKEFSMNRAKCPGDAEFCVWESSGKYIGNTANMLASGSEYASLCYDNNCTKEGAAELGDPCGNDGGICVPTGPDCTEYPGRKGRENVAGGKSCGSGLKCCY